ncbi:MAG: hypothetical protein AB1404_00045, partial [Spirochaetota bacterium]
PAPACASPAHAATPHQPLVVGVTQPHQPRRPPPAPGVRCFAASRRLFTSTLARPPLLYYNSSHVRDVPLPAE